MKRTLLCMILALCCLALSGCTVFGRNVRVGLITEFAYEDADGYEIGDAALAGEVRRVEIQWMDGSVEIVEGDGASISERASRELPEDLRMRWRLEDGTLKIMYCNSGRWSIDGLDKALTVTLPRTALESLNVTAVSADVRVPQLSARSVECGTTSGDVSAALSGVSELRVRTISGAVNVTSMDDAGRVDVDSTSGAVGLKLGQVDVLDAVTISGGLDVSAGHIRQMDAGTTSGDVLLKLAEGCDACTIRTISGDIALTLPEDAGLTLGFGTVSGQLNSEIALRSRDGVQIAGDGAQQFDVNTTSGGLTLRTEREIPEDK